MGSRHGKRRWLRRTALVLGILAALLALVLATRNRWGPAALETALARFAGIEARIGATEGPWIDGLTLRDVVLRGTARRPEIEELACERLELEYDLAALARGELAGLQVVRARGLRGELDLAPRPRAPDDPKKPRSAGSGWPAHWPELELDASLFSLAFGGGRSLALSSAVLRLAAETKTLDLSAAAIVWRDPGREVEAELALRATDSGGGRLRVERLSLAPWISLSRGELDLGELREQRWRARADAELAAGEASFAVARAGTRTSASISARAIDLARLADLPFVGPALAAAGPLRGRLDLSGDVLLPAEGLDRASGELRFEAVDPGWRDRSVELARGVVAFSEEHVEVRRLSLVQAPNLLEVPTFFVPRDAYDRCFAWEDSVASFRLDAADLKTLLGDPALDELPPHRLTLEGLLREGTAELVRGDFSIVGGEVLLERGRVPIARSLERLLADPVLDLELRARFADLSPLGRLISTEPWKGSLALTARVRGGESGARGQLAASGADVTFAGRPIGALELSGEVDRHHLQLERCTASSPQGTLACVVDYDFGSRRLEIAALEAELQDLSIYAPDLLPRAHVRVSGAAAGVWPDLDGAIELSASGVRWRDRELDTLDLELSREHQRWTVARLSASGPQGTLDAAGSFGRQDGGWQADLDTLALEHEDRTLLLLAPAAIEIAGGRVRASAFELSGTAGLIAGDLDVGADRGELSLRCVRFDPAPLEAAPWRMALGFRGLDGEARVRWSSAGLELATAALRAELDLKSTGAPGVLVLRASSSADRLDLGELSLVSGEDVLFDAAGSSPLPARDAAGRLAFPDQPFELRAHANLPALDRLGPIAYLLPAGWRPAGTLALSLDLAGTTARLSGTALVSARGLSLASGDERVLVPECDLDLEAELGPGITLRSAQLSGPSGVRLAAAGVIDAVPDLSRLLAEGAGPIARAPLQGVLFLDEVDLTGALPYAPALRRTGGVARADLSVSGSIAEPRWAGLLSITGGELRTTTTLPAIAGLDAELRFDGDTVSIERLRGELGGAPFELSGSYRLRGPERGASIDLSGENLLFYRQSGITIRGDAELAIRGPYEALEVEGEVFLRDSRYVRDFDFLRAGRGGPSPSASRGLQIFSIEEPPFSNLRFDVAIRTLEPVRIANNTADGAVRPELQLEGTGLLPVLRGRIYIDKTKVRLPASSLRVRSGTVDFLPQRPYLPELEIAAEARLQGYDISVRVSGPYDKPVIDLSSVPPLGHEDLLLLVLTGRPPGEALGARTGERAAQEVAVYVARDVFGDWFGSGDGGGKDGESIVERVEVYQGENVSRSGRETTEVRFKLAEGVWLANDALMLTGELDVYEHYNFGVRLLFRFR